MARLQPWGVRPGKQLVKPQNTNQTIITSTKYQLQLGHGYFSPTLFDYLPIAPPSASSRSASRASDTCSSDAPSTKKTDKMLASPRTRHYNAYCSPRGVHQCYRILFSRQKQSQDSGCYKLKAEVGEGGNMSGDGGGFERDGAESGHIEIGEK